MNILLIEEHEAIRCTLKELLEREGHTATAIAEKSLELSTLVDPGFDFILITRLAAREMNFASLLEFRRDTRYQKIPILVSGSPDAFDLQVISKLDATFIKISKGIVLF